MATTSGTAVIAAGVALIINVLMARLAGPEMRGEVAWVLQGAYLLSPLLALGVDRQALRGSVVSSSQKHVWTLGIVGLTVSLAAGSTNLALCVVIAIEEATFGIYLGRSLASGRVRLYIKARLAVAMWTLVAAGALYVLEVKDPTWWLGVYAAPTLPLLIIAVRQRESGLVGRSVMSGVSKASLGYMVGGFGALSAARIERVLLPVLSSTEALGHYIVIATMSEMLVWFATGLSQSRVMPLMGRQPSRGDLARGALRDLWGFLLLAVPLALAIRFLLIPILGPSFEQSRVLIVPLCLSSVAWALYLQLSAAWLASGTVRQSTMLDMSAAIVTAVLVIALTPMWGALGAALACLTAYTSMAFAAVVLFPKFRPKVHVDADD